MKKKNINFFMIVLGFVLLYFILLVVLVLSERNHPDTQIKNLWDALWFSLVTLSTVGYGDMTPQSVLGRVIGIFFLILSMGVLVALFGSMVSFLTSEGLPLMALRLRRHHDWYYFADFTAESDTLAKDILRQDASAVIIYGIKQDDEIETPDYTCYFLNLSPARIVAHKKGRGNRCRLFFLKENEIGSSLKAIDVHALPAEIYAATTSGQERMSGNINFFHTYDCCARSYWRDHPLKPGENVVVLIGFGNYGQALLERAIFNNISDSDFEVRYHIFGDSERFRNIHHNLHLAFGINEIRKGHDSLYFHQEDWTAASDLVCSADRIILCEDDFQTGWDDLWQIRRYYNASGQIDLRTSRRAPGVSYFGTDEEIYTVDQIIRTRLNDAARVMNDLYRRSEPDSLDWDDLSDQLKQSKIAAADHLFTKIRILLDDRTISSLDRTVTASAYREYCRMKKDPQKLDRLRRIEHARWVRFYVYHNWSGGSERNTALHTDPMIGEYETLSESRKAYHDRAWELLREFAD